MPFPTDSFLLLILTSLFNQNYAGVFHLIERPKSENLSEFYSRVRSTNVYRGALLTKSAEGQKELCKAIFASQTFTHVEITLVDNAEQKSGSTGPSQDVPPVSIVVKQMVYVDEVIAKEEIFILCPGQEEASQFLDEPGDIDIYYASFAFETNVFFIGQRYETNPSGAEMLVDYKLSMHPEIILDNEFEIRDLYVAIRQNIEALRAESPKYVKMVEDRDDIQALSGDDQILVCHSVLGSPQMQSQKVEIDPKWAEWDKNIVTLDQPIHFLNKDNTKNELSSKNILCKARNKDSRERRTFYYTPSYNNKNSVFFLKPEGKDIHFDLYVENIPTLINAATKSSPIFVAATS